MKYFKLQINYKSGHKMTFRAKSYKVKRDGSGMIVSFEYEGARSPTPIASGNLEDIESIWKL